jgi:hypothetical protein
MGGRLEVEVGLKVTEEELQVLLEEIKAILREEGQDFIIERKGNEVTIVIDPCSLLNSQD